MNEEKTLSLSELAFVLGTSSQTVSNLNTDNNGPKFERGSRNSVVYKLEDVEAWIDEEEKKKINEVGDEANIRRDRLSTFSND